MKTSKINKIIASVEAKIKKAKDKNLINDGSIMVEYVDDMENDYEDMPEDDIPLDSDPYRLSLNIDVWPESTRTLTEKGKNELWYERKAVENIVEFIKGFDLEMHQSGHEDDRKYYDFIELTNTRTGL